MRLLLSLSLFVCIACYPNRDSTDPAPTNQTETVLDAGGNAQPPVNESPDGGGENSETPETDAGQGTEEPEPTLDAGSESGNEATADAGLNCDPGYFENASTGQCEDVNECLQSNGGCLQTCLNTAGSFECGCFPGYDLNEDNVSCHDINECEENLDGCEENCINTQGSFECSCNSSRFLNEDGLTCQSNIESAQTVATNWAVGDISLMFNADDLYEQSSLAGSVNFVDAFFQGITKLLDR